MNSRWKQYLLYASVIILGGGLIFILIETVKAKNTGFETKTLWDWMELLIIPLFLVGGAYFLNRSEQAIERKAAENRAELEREIALDKQQEEALQIYIDRMADLLLAAKLKTNKKKEVRDVARTRTLTVLSRLDGKRKAVVVLFLMEAGLITNKPVVDISGANLRNVDLSFAELSGVYLHHVDLSGANLSYSDLSGADLSDTHLSDGFLRDEKHALPANLSNANLSGANLTRADLVRAKLRGANITNANLNRASMIEADLSAEGSAGLLFPTNLSGANLQGVHLGKANLANAILTNADLSNAMLAGTNLSQATILDEQLESAFSLKGATMPDGTTHD